MNAKVVPRNSKRFLNIGLLKSSTPVLGSTAGTWDRAIKGNMAANLQDVQRRVMAVRAKGPLKGPETTSGSAGSTNLASAVSTGTLAKR